MTNDRFKFRGLDENNNIYDLSAINWDNITGLCEVEGYSGPVWCKFQNLIQSTGLKDKNGKLIYEGDVLRCYFDKDQLADWLIVHFSNKVLEQGFFDEIIEIPEIYTKPLPDEYEVIGNIYENPKLLENDK